MARKPLTEEEKMKRAENLKKAREAKKAKNEAKTPIGDETVVVEGNGTPEAKYEVTEASEVDKLKSANELLMEELRAMKEQLAELSKAKAAESSEPKVIRVSSDVERVHFLWQAEVSDENVILFGDGGIYGRIIGKTGSFFVPKDEISRILDSMNRYFLEQRWLIVVSGLNEEEREAMGVNYKEGEILDRQAFAKMIEIGDEMLNIYPKLCKGHKEMVAKRYYESYQNGNLPVKRETILELNRMSKEAGSTNGDFTRLIEMINEDELR